MTDTRPPAEASDFSYHWLHAERASEAAIAQWTGSAWACINETYVVFPTEMYRRGGSI